MCFNSKIIENNKKTLENDKKINIFFIITLYNIIVFNYNKYNETNKALTPKETEMETNEMTNKQKANELQNLLELHKRMTKEEFERYLKQEIKKLE